MVAQKRELWIGRNRNDHRHHAVDALTVAFTTHNHIQYLNNLSAKSDRNSNVYAIENTITEVVNRKRRFIAPTENFREDAKHHLENILVSIKSKTKVVTTNKNKIKTKKGTIVKTELTPRGQLHKETVYGRIKQYFQKEEKIGSNFTKEKILQVANESYRKALMSRLKEFDLDPKKAFTGKNNLSKNLYI